MMDAFTKYDRATELHFGRHQDFARRLERAGRSVWAASYRTKSPKFWAGRHNAMNIRLPAEPPTLINAK